MPARRRNARRRLAYRITIAHLRMISIREAVRTAPGYIDAWISLAATLATESRFPEAEQAVQRALEIDPQNANALELQKELANAAAGQAKQ